MESCNLPNENETADVPLNQAAPLRSWKDLLHELLAPGGPPEGDEEHDNDDDEA